MGKYAVTYLLFICLFFGGCKILDVISVVGAGASMGAFVAPAILSNMGKVKPKEVLAKIDLAFQQYSQEKMELLEGLSKVPRERKDLVKVYNRELASSKDTLRLKLKEYSKLLSSGYDLPQDIVDLLSSKEGQESIYAMSSMLPPPWDKIAPGGLSLGLLVSTIVGFKGRNGYLGLYNRRHALAILLGNMIDSMKASGLVSKDKVRELAQEATSKSNISNNELHTFLKNYNIS